MKIIKSQCWICAKKFDVKIKDDGTIVTKCFHSYIRKNLFLWWLYEWNTKSWKSNGITFQSKFKKVLGYTRPQRWLIYNVWNLLYGRQKIEYWECTKCSKRPNDK